MPLYTPKKPKRIKRPSKSYKQTFCPCGNPAKRRFIGGPACERCIEIDTQRAYDTGRAGVRRGDVPVDFYETGLAED